MSTKTRAELIACVLARVGCGPQPLLVRASDALRMDAAAELRRLSASEAALLEAAEMVIAWFDAEEDHSRADFYQRIQMCRDSEAALRAAVARTKEARNG